MYVYTVKRYYAFFINVLVNFTLLGINIALVSGGGQLDCVHGNSVIHCQV